MRCPCGCRKQHEAEGSQERSAAYRETEKGRKKKQELNRRRHLKSVQAKQRQQNDSSQQRLPALLRYYRWIILLLDGVLMDVPRLKEFIEGIRGKVRQRGRAQYDDSHYIYDD